MVIVVCYNCIRYFYGGDPDKYDYMENSIRYLKECPHCREKKDK